MEVACITDMGKSREINEDNCVHCKIDSTWELLIVADGMGGHNAGEVASSIAVESIINYIKSNLQESETCEGIVQIIKSAVLKANSDIYMQSVSNNSYSGMGTTVTLAMLSRETILIGHVGDSRAYIVAGNKLSRLTSDHSLVAELVKNGTITELEAQNHPQKNIITRALGTGESLEVDIETINVTEDYIIILCTDGLTNMVSDEDIEQILINVGDVDAAAQKMVDIANELGGYDNITVAIAKRACTDSEVRP